MDISPAYIPLMNVIAVIHRVHLPKSGELKATRRVTSVDEIVDFENYRNAFEWKPIGDKFKSSIENSVILPNISKHSGLTKMPEQRLYQHLKKTKDKHVSYFTPTTSTLPT